MTSDPTKTYHNYTDFFEHWRSSNDYLPLNELQHLTCYRVFARNAEVGIWDEHYQGFLIARFKVGPKPYLFYERHWDSCADHGTVKPIEKLSDCPISIKPLDELPAEEQQQLLDFLICTERQHPLVAGHDSVTERQASAVRFLAHLQRKKPR